MLRMTSLFLAVLLLLPCLTLAPEAKEISLSGECACLYMPAQTEFLVDRNANRRHPMASTTKIMTALTVLEHCALDETVKIPKEACGVEGSSVYLREGEEMRVEELLYALMLASANDAAAALALHVSGDIPAFAEQMNRRASDMGLTDTHFTNPHGLADKEHYTTASDLARITAEAMKNEDFSRIVATKSKVITSKDGQKRTLSNHNRLLRSYEDCVGVKTGFTKDSGRCLVSAAERDGLLLIAVTLDAPNDWRDHTAMLDYGFSLYEGHRLDGYLGRTVKIPVVGGIKEEVELLPQGEETVILPKGSPELEISLELNRFAPAPIKEGQILGKIRYTQNKKTVAVLPLLAAEAVEARPIRNSLWDKFKNLWNK